MADERMRLLALVRSEASVGHAERNAQPYHLETGDNEWFLANISCQYACPAYTDVARYIAHIAAEDYNQSYQITSRTTSYQVFSVAYVRAPASLRAGEAASTSQ